MTGGGVISFDRLRLNWGCDYPRTIIRKILKRDSCCTHLCSLFKSRDRDTLSRRENLKYNHIYNEYRCRGVNCRNTRENTMINRANNCNCLIIEKKYMDMQSSLQFKMYYYSAAETQNRFRPPLLQKRASQLRAARSAASKFPLSSLVTFASIALLTEKSYRHQLDGFDEIFISFRLWDNPQPCRLSSLCEHH